MVVWQGGSKKMLDIFLGRYHRSVKGFAWDKQLLSLHLLLVSIGTFLLIQDVFNSVIVYASIHKQYTDTAV